ncbi:MAG: PrgI family protein [Candidatus Berkelbacteria bacterium]
MRTTVVPAQITTVEDRIAGNLTFVQIVLMIIPLLTSTALYVLLPTKMHFNPTKGILIGLQFLFFDGLAIRFRGKILAEWLVIYLRYKARPRRYIFTKNDLSCRNGYLGLNEKSEPTIEEKEEIKEVKPNDILDTSEKIKVEQLLKDPLLTLSFKIAKKGGIDVTLKPNKN